MKRIIIPLFSVLVVYHTQLAAQCANNNTLLSTYTPICNGVSAVATNCIQGGQYLAVNVVAGNIYTFSTCGNTAFDSQITIYNSTGGGSLGYNDDGCGTQSTVTWTATFTGVLWVLVDQYSCANNTTCIPLNITCGAAPPPLSNDNPCNAIPLTVGTTCSYTSATTAGATPTTGVPVPGCASYSGSDVWFTAVVPASGSLTLDGQAGVVTDGGMAVYSATACNGTFTLIECDDDDGTGLMPNLNLTSLTPGSTIYIRFWEFGGDNNGSFGICAYDNNPPPPPPSTVCLSPMPDNCASACNLGALPAPSPCTAVQTSSPGQVVTFSMTNVGATAANPYSSILGCANPAGDVWYRFQATGTELVFSLNSTTDILNTPNVSLYNGNNCNALLPLQCFVGAGGNLPATTYSPLTPGDFYYLQISGADPTDVGNFNLLIRNNYICNTCLLASDLQVTPPPVNGTYNAGQTVNFCYTVSNYNQTAANWLHGVDLNFGPGWDLATLVPVSSPSSCATTTGATWGFYNSVTGGFSGTVYGPGFFYETSSGGPALDGNPGNNFGDQGVGLTCPLTFCWRISTDPLAACIDGSSLNVAINTLGDYESGSWSSVGCQNDPIVNFNAALSCCPQALIASTPSTCGAATGTATATGQGLNPPFDYTWSDASGTILSTVSNVNGPNTISNLAAGQYFVTVVDNNNCTSNQTATVTSSGGATLNVSNTGPYCQSSTISLTATAAGALSYSWSGPNGFNSTIQNPNIANSTIAMSGLYYVTATFSGGCTATGSTNVVVNTLPVAAITSGNVSICNGLSTTLTASGGSSYLWSNVATTSAITVSPTASSNYSVTVTDANSCSATASATVTVNQLPVAAITPFTVSICNGASTTLSASGGSSYVWSNAATTSNISVTPSTTSNYSVTATDVNNCTATASATVAVNPLPVAAINPPTVSICNGSNATLTASGGSSYLWSNSATAAIISVTPSTTSSYFVTVTDVNSCSATASATVTVNPLPVAAITPATVSICNGASTTLTATGGSSYVWSNAGNSASITVSPISTTVYSVTATDINTCTATASRTVTVNPLPVAVINPATISICTGASTTLTGSGGVTYLWSNAANTAAITVSPLATTTYLLTVSDANACTATASSVVTVNSLPLAAINPSAVSICSGTSTTLIASGGITYAWSNASNTSAITVSPSTNTVYSVTVTDFNSCTATRSSTVNIIPSMVVAATTTNIICNGGNNGNINLSVSSGQPPYSFIWSNSATTQNVSNLIPGLYTVTITDNAGCSASASSTITQPTLLSVSESHVNVACNTQPTGAIDIATSGGILPYTYTWNDAVATEDRSLVSAGTYTVTVTDDNNCSSSVSVTISEPTPLVVSETHVDVPCSGGNTGSIDLTVSGASLPYQFNWNDGFTTEDRFNLTLGNYGVTITDNNSCSSSLMIAIVSNSGLGIVETHQAVACNGDSTGNVDVSVSGGLPPYNYTWNDGITTEDRINISSGSYSVSATDGNGCVISVNITIDEPSILSIAETHTDVLCNAGNTGAINIDVSGATAPYVYLWNDAVTTEDRSNLNAGVYFVTVHDNNQCSATQSVNVSEPSTLVATETHVDVSCFGASTGSIDVTSNGGISPYSYVWSDGFSNEDRSNIAAGNYVVSVNDSNACATMLSVIISQPNAISISEVHINALCFGSSDAVIDITASGGSSPYVYAWNDLVTTEDRNNLTAGTYSVTVNDSYSCSSALSISVSQPAALVITETHQNPSCFTFSDASIFTTVTGGVSPYAYLWNDADTSPLRSGLNAGTYTVTVSDYNQCTVSSSISLIEPSGMNLTSSFTNPTCETNGDDGNIVLNVTGGSSPYSYNWSGTYPMVDLTQLGPGDYQVTVSDANNCSVSASFVLSYQFDFSVSATNAVTINFGDFTTLGYTLTGNAGNYTNIWSPPSSLSCSDCVNPLASPVVSTLYQIVVTNDEGCIASDTVSVYVVPNYDIFIPNAFTPNGDGYNDLFSLFGNIKMVAYLDMKIFNRWGEKVFESNDHNFTWDGSYKGELQNPQVFTWQLKITFLDGYKEELRKGTLTLVR